MIYSSHITLIAFFVVSRMFIHHLLLCDIPGHFPSIRFQFGAKCGLVHIDTCWQMTGGMCAELLAVVNECESVICNILDGIDKVDLLPQIPSQLA